MDSDQATWSELAGALFAMGPVAILEGTTICGMVTGYTDDPAYGKLIRIQRVDEKGNPLTPPPKHGIRV